MYNFFPTSLASINHSDLASIVCKLYCFIPCFSFVSFSSTIIVWSRLFLWLMIVWRINLHDGCHLFRTLHHCLPPFLQNIPQLAGKKLCSPHPANLYSLQHTKVFWTSGLQTNRNKPDTFIWLQKCSIFISWMNECKLNGRLLDFFLYLPLLKNYQYLGSGFFHFTFHATTMIKSCRLMK